MVANILETRKQEVHIVTKDTDELIRLPHSEMITEKEIEEPLINKLATYHSDFIAKSTTETTTAATAAATTENIGIP